MGKQTTLSKLLSLFLIGILILFSSCKKEKKVTETENSNTSVKTEIKKAVKKIEAKDLFGAWTEPVPSFEKAQQGFLLKEDGTAISLNVDEPLHMKWSVKEDNLTFEYPKDSLKDPDVFIIKSLNDTILRLKMNDILFNLKRNDTIK